MSHANPDHAPEGWDSIAETYDRVAVDHLTPYAEAAHRLLRPAASDRVLDVACGPGTFALLAAPSASRVVAVDFAPAMVERLRARIAARGIANVTARVMDAQALDLEDDAFDAVGCLFGVLHTVDPRRALRELARVTKPGGRVAVSSWSAPPRMRNIPLLLGGLARVLPNLPGPPPPPLALHDPEAFAGALREAGFENVDVYTVTHGWRFDDAQAFWDQLSRLAPAFQMLLQHVGPAKADEIRRAVVENVRNELGNGPLVIDNEAHIAVGVRRA